MKKIAIAGLAPSSRDRVNSLDDSFEIWGMNDGWDWLGRYDRWFQIHEREMIRSELLQAQGRPGDQFTWLQTCGVPVYLAFPQDDIPTGEVFPYDEITAAHGPRREDGSRYHYFTSTVAYMVALAVYEGFDELHIYGVDLTSDLEYREQRACVEYWLGLANSVGKVIIPDESALLKGAWYGRPSSEPDFKVMAQKRVNKAKDDYMTALAQYLESIGRFRESSWWAAVIAQSSPPEAVESAEQRKAFMASIVDERRKNLDAQIGLVRSEQHWLSVQGIVDQHPATLPDVKIPEELTGEEMTRFLKNFKGELHEVAN